MEPSLNQTLNNGSMRTMEVGTAQRFLRNSSLIKQSKLDKATIIGAGGIGSALIQSAAIMGWKELDIWDYDMLEEHNLSTTMYPAKYLNRYKSEIAGEIALKYGCKKPVVNNIPWGAGDRLHNKVFMCPDNMEVRMAVYKYWLKNPNREFLVDMRMGALSMEIITVTPLVDHFMSSWMPSSKISDEECTAKHTIFTASVSSGLGLTQAFKVLNDRPYYAYIWQSLSPISLTREHLVKPII